MPRIIGARKPPTKPAWPARRRRRTRSTVASSRNASTTRKGTRWGTLGRRLLVDPSMTPSGLPPVDKVPYRKGDRGTNSAKMAAFSNTNREGKEVGMDHSRTHGYHHPTPSEATPGFWLGRLPMTESRDARKGCSARRIAFSLAVAIQSKAQGQLRRRGGGGG